MKRFLHISIVTVLITLTSVSVASDKIYWTAGGKIQRSNFDGTEVEDAITGLSEPEEVAVNFEAGKIYWADHGTSKIQRANLDGSSVEDIVTGVESWSIAIDADAGKIYWTEYSEDKVQRANLDGSGVELLYDGTGQANGIALDICSGKMYWADDLGGKIMRANLDGSQVEDVITGIFAPKGLAVDCCAGKLYWAEGLFDSSIHSSDIDGTNVVELVSTYAWDISLNLFNGKIIWTNDLSDKIQRCDFDGSNLEDVTSTANSPKGIGLAMKNNSKPGDLDKDCDVDNEDFAVLAGQWMQQGSYSADIAPDGGDGTVNWFDLKVLIDNWLEGTAP